MIHLDTNVLVSAIVSNTDTSRRLDEWLQGGESVEISVLVWSEFLCGPLSTEDRTSAEVLFPEVVPLSKSAAAIAAELFNVGGRRRGSMLDCMIAATAIDGGAALATLNTADFRRFVPSGLTLI